MTESHLEHHFERKDKRRIGSGPHTWNITLFPPFCIWKILWSFSSLPIPAHPSKLSHNITMKIVADPWWQVVVCFWVSPTYRSTFVNLSVHLEKPWLGWRLVFFLFHFKSLTQKKKHMAREMFHRDLHYTHPHSPPHNHKGCKFNSSLSNSY